MVATKCVFGPEIVTFPVTLSANGSVNPRNDYDSPHEDFELFGVIVGNDRHYKDSY